MAKQIPLIIAIIVVIILIVLVIFLGGKKEGTPGEAPPDTEEKTLPEEIYGLSGTITDIEENAILIDAIIIFTDGTQGRASRKVLIDENTEITKLIFPEVSPEDRDKPIQPQEIKLNFSDLKTGDNIEATAKENLRDKTEFTAESINVIE